MLLTSTNLSIPVRFLVRQHPYLRASRFDCIVNLSSELHTDLVLELEWKDFFYFPLKKEAPCNVSFALPSSKLFQRKLALFSFFRLHFAPLTRAAFFLKSCKSDWQLKVAHCFPLLIVQSGFSDGEIYPFLYVLTIRVWLYIRCYNISHQIVLK